MSLCRSQLILRKFAIREMCQRSVAKPSFGLGPRLKLAVREEPIELIAEPHVEAGVIEAGHLEIDLAVVGALEDGHDSAILPYGKSLAPLTVELERLRSQGLGGLCVGRFNGAEIFGAVAQN
jgi:hypothetical protein